MTALNAKLVVDGDQTWVSLVGALDMDATSDLLALATAATERHGIRTLTLDMSGVDFIDSMGIAALVRTYKMCADEGAELQLRYVAPRVRHVFALTGLTEWFGLEPG